MAWLISIDSDKSWKSRGHRQGCKQDRFCKIKTKINTSSYKTKTKTRTSKTKTKTASFKTKIKTHSSTTKPFSHVVMLQFKQPSRTWKQANLSKLLQLKCLKLQPVSLFGFWSIRYKIWRVDKKSTVHGFWIGSWVKTLFQDQDQDQDLRIQDQDQRLNLQDQDQDRW